jgi:hypothetical protein
MSGPIIAGFIVAATINQAVLHALFTGQVRLNHLHASSRIHLTRVLIYAGPELPTARRKVSIP